ncbi:hypothetical protein Tco_1493822 [Tanacetum coccineum]
MSLLCGNSSSWSPKNSHTIIESLPTSTTLVEDSDSNIEEIDIFSGPDDSIPPGIESDFDSEEDIIDNLLNDDLIPEYERLTFDMEMHQLGCAETKVATWDDLAFKLIILSWNVKHGTDIAKISRKRSKPDKHGHGNGRARKKPGESYQKSRVVNSSQPNLGFGDLESYLNMGVLVISQWPSWGVELLLQLARLSVNSGYDRQRLVFLFKNNKLTKAKKNNGVLWTGRGNAEGTGHAHKATPSVLRPWFASIALPTTSLSSIGAYKAGLESVEARLDVYKKNEVVFEEDIKILKLDIKLRDNALTELRKKFEKAEKERDDLKLTLEKFENSSKNLSKLLDSQVCDKFKTGVGFDSQVVDSQVFDSQENDRYKTSKGYHAVPPPYTGNFMPPKSDLVLADEDEYVFSELVTSIPDVATSEAKTSESKPKSVGEPLIEDWISDSEDENESESKSKQIKSSFSKVKFVKSNEHVKTPKESVKKVENDKQAKYPRKNSQSPRVFLDKKVEGMSKHKKIYVTPSHTKKVFANMKRQGKDFSSKDTPLFQTMMVQAQEEGKGSVMPTVPQHTPTINQPSSSQPHKKQKPRKSKKRDTRDSQPCGPIEPMADETKNVESIPTHSNDPLLSDSSEDEGLGDQEDASKQGRKIVDIDADEETTFDWINSRGGKYENFNTLIEIKAAKPKAVTIVATTTTTAVTRPKARGVVVQEPSEFTTTTTQPSQLP